jgi:hypothetical protein
LSKGQTVFEERSALPRLDVPSRIADQSRKNVWPFDKLRELRVNLVESDLTPNIRGAAHELQRRGEFFTMYGECPVPS